MTEQRKVTSAATPEQVRYANLLFYGAWLGIFMMFVTYGLYVTGILAPHVPMEMVTASWKMSVVDYMHHTNSPNGWGWAALLHRGDFINFIPIALLALLTIVCYFTLIPGYYRRKDYKYMFFAIAEIIVLAVAASGLLGSGGH